MTLGFTATQFIKKLEAYCSPTELKKYHRFFKFDFDKDKPDEDFVFIDVRMGQVFALAKECIEMPLDEIEKLLESPIQKVRVGAVSIMDFQARSKKTSEARKKELFNLYLRRHDRINSWDLVDRSAPYVVGGYLFDKRRDSLYKLARSKNIWERRTAIVSTGFFIRQRDIIDTFKIAELLRTDKQDLIHKATGWMLRAAGDVDRPKLLAFLDKHAATLPRTLLRYAIEHLDKEQRELYMRMKKN
jgi:3-methyladenine DNA glycosylase AlkD